MLHTTVILLKIIKLSVTYQYQNVIKHSLISKIKNMSISIISDDTSDIGHHEQMSIVLRFFDDENNCPVEYFVTFYSICSIYF